MTTVSGRLPVKVLPVGEDGKAVSPATQMTLATVAAGIGEAGDEANEPTVIGLLKQVIAKLDEVKTAIESQSG